MPLDLTTPKRPIIFDCETGPIPEPELTAMMPEFKAPKNYKTQEAIEGDIARQQVEYYERAALSALTGRVLCIGLMQGEEIIVIDGESPRNEGDILQEFWDYFSVEGAPVFTGFCIKSFDLPFLCRRSWKHGVHVPWQVKNGRYWSERFVDLQDIWLCGEYAKENRISLDALARHLDAGPKLGTGADFAKLWCSDRPAALNYLTNDLRITAAIAKKLGVL